MKNPVLLASLSLVGTIVGAGIFGIPYVFAQSGSWLSLAYCAVLGAAALLIHWFYAQVVAVTPGKHRLVGYVHKHLGPRQAEVVSVTSPMNMLGSMLAYLILGGGFLSTLFGGSAFVWSIAFLAALSLILLLPFGKVEFLEAGLSWLLIAAAVGIVIAVAPHIQIKNLTAFGAGRWFLPYGVVFFALSGASVIPDLVECLNKDMKKVWRAILIGTVVSVVITAVFGLAVAGVSGLATTQNAVLGLVPFVGRYIVAAGAVFGLLAIVTSFLAIGENLKEQFNMDFKMSLPASWMATVGIPLIAFLAGARDLISVLGFVGAVFGVIDGFLIALMAKKISTSRVLRRLMIPLIVVFTLGILSEIIPLFR